MQEQRGQEAKKKLQMKKKLYRACKAAGIMGAVAGLLIGAVAVFLLMQWKAGKAADTYTKNLQKEKNKTESVQKELDQTTEGKQAKLKDADWNLLLVGKDYPLDESFKVKLETVEEEFQLDYRVVESAKKMLEAARAEELNPVITSAYLDNEQQKKLFNTQMELETESGLSYLDAYEATLKATALPGAGEHATGLALDIVSGDYQNLDEKQANTKENKWLQEHCAEYGFILRYPSGKEDVTGRNYESWHFRYVGTEAAQEIVKQGITLEEYVLGQ